MSENSNEDRLDTINMSDDLESQKTNLRDKFLENYLEIPLKGILKKQSSFAEEDDTLMLNRFISFGTCVIMVIIFVPMVFCDLYYGFTDKSCINEMPDGLNYTMKLYLLVSGFCGLVSMLISICIACSLTYNNTNDEKKILYAKLFGILCSLFQIIWNILGATTFWGTIYKEGNCDLTISTYIYISLIVKIVCNLFNITDKINKK